MIRGLGRRARHMAGVMRIFWSLNCKLLWETNGLWMLPHVAMAAGFLASERVLNGYKNPENDFIAGSVQWAMRQMDAIACDPLAQSLAGQLKEHLQ